MDDNDFAESRWPGHVARGCFGLAIVVVAAWWFVTRERPVAPQRNSTQNLTLLRDPTQRPSARRFAADHLQGADVSVVPDLIQTLEEGDPLGREFSAMALGRMGPKAGDAAEALTKAANDPEPSVRAQAIVALGRLAEVGKLANLLAHDNADVRRRAAIEMGQAEVVGEQFIDDLRRVLADPDAHVRAEVYAALWKLAAISAPDLTAGLTGDPDRIVRRMIVILLSRLPDPDPETLVPALNDVEPLVRTRALEELGKMGAAAGPAVPAMIRLLDSSDEKTAQNAAVALRKIGPPARAAIGALIEHCDDPRDGVSAFSRAALYEISRESELRPPELFSALHADGDTAPSLILWDPGYPRQPFAVTDADMQHVKKLKQLRLLELGENPIGDAGLAEIAELTELRRLNLSRTAIRSDGLRHLAGLVNLRTLNLAHCAIDDQGLEQLAHLRGLKRLFLNGTLVTDAGMPHLAKLSQLSFLSLGETNVTEAGLAHLKNLESLEEISFRSGQFSLAALAQLPGLTTITDSPKTPTDGDLETLTGLKRLKTLVLSHISISEAGMVSVGKIAALEALFLNDSSITDAGLSKLKPLANLRVLSLTGVKVSQPAVDQLKESHPELAIWPFTGPAAANSIDYEVVGLKSVVDAR